MALIAFLVIAAPFIAALSVSKGRLTYGDSGKLNYAWYVNSVTQWVHWQGEPHGSGFPEHPVRKIFSKPDTYEFGTPRGGTYPAWYDPSYWHEGIQVHFDLRKQLSVLNTHIKEYSDVLFKEQYVLLIGCLILYYMSGRKWLCIKDFAEQWLLYMPAFTLMAIYALVHVERRFLGAFNVLLWIGIFSGAKIPRSNISKSFSSYIVVFMAMAMMIGAVYSPLSGAYNLIKTNKIITPSSELLEVVNALDRMGVGRGDKIAVIGWTINIHWARLAGVQIVADIPLEEKNTFLDSDSSVKSQALAAFLKTGAKGIVIFQPSDDADLSEAWKRLGNTDFYIYKLIE
ncbi:MAG: hypothetical protein HZC49_14300 [Nitrospirae bacterium]|nr:hypothetical protein [Nitrospirota bacterium]